MTKDHQYKSLYVLAAKGIQDYILKGDKLRLMIGGSELVESLSTSFMEQILRNAGLEPVIDYMVLSQTAGSSRILFKEHQSAAHIAELMPPAVALYAPGLDIVQAIVAIDNGLANAIDNAEKMLGVRRNFAFPSFPVPNPMGLRCPRSGQQAVNWFRQGDQREPADAAMVAKDRASKGARSSLAEKSLPPEGSNSGKSSQIPIAENFEDLVSTETSNIAVIHIDGNSLGLVVRKVLEDLKEMEDSRAAEAYSHFCSAIDEATQAAVRFGLQPIIEETRKNGFAVYPFRLLVCAGDDVTIVMRACDAIAFTQRFLERFDEGTREKLASVGIPSLQGKSLTACAGIAYIKKSFPFAHGYALCESLCRFTKTATARRHSALAFWRQTTATAGSFENTVKEELFTNNITMTAMPYVLKQCQLDAIPRFATIDELRNLADAVDRLPRGSLRGLLNEFYTGRQKALQYFQRICDVAADRNTKDALDNLMTALQAITGQEGHNALFGKARTGTGDFTPIHDAIELRGVGY